MKWTRDHITTLALKHMPLLLFIGVFLGFGLLSPRFFEYQSLENIVKQASYIGIVAVGITCVLLTAGIDLSVGANMYLSAAVAGVLMSQYALPIWAAFFACIAVGVLFGAVNAFAVTRLRIIPFIATLATLVAGRGMGLLATGSRAVPYPDPLIRFGAGRLAGLVPMPVVIFAIVVVLAHLFLRRTQMGRQIYAVGNDAEAARKAGINTDRVLVTVYVVCGALAALAGFVSVTQLGVVNAGFGEGDEFDAIAAAVLGGASLFGGRGNIFPGTVLGTVLIQMVGVGLVFTQIDLYLQPLFIALIILLAVWLDSVRTTQIARRERRHIRPRET